MGSVSQYEETVVVASFFGVVWMGSEIRDIILRNIINFLLHLDATKNMPVRKFINNNPNTTSISETFYPS